MRLGFIWCKHFCIGSKLVFGVFNHEERKLHECNQITLLVAFSVVPFELTFYFIIVYLKETSKFTRHKLVSNST
jgi:hypothetical protein